ncbi:hypothetical protein [Listeria booriae]|uniref:hypothetical protein n=1 Tax=Listeria booriae TaxID=1552123 RepID=UPI0016278C7C|nr:hypothetical protein [Listeria booriae]MBC1272611.1 hypothetical protein [Listeria booriae]
MKKWQLILGSLLLVIILAVGGYMLYVHINTKQADNQINSIIEEAGIPKNGIIVIEKTKYNQKVLSDEWWTKEITTEKDYENWKRTVKEQQHFLNGDKLTSKNESKLDSKTNCELKYNFAYYKNPDKVYGDYVISGDSVSSDAATRLFAYTIPKNHLPL